MKRCFFLPRSATGLVTLAIRPAIVSAFHKSTTGEAGDSNNKITAIVNGKTYPSAIDKQGQFSFNFNKEVQVIKDDIIKFN